MRISSPGRRSRRLARGERGTVLIDVLVALMIASSALLLSLGNIAFAGHIAAKDRERVVQFITAGNATATQRQGVFRTGGALP